MATGLFDTPSRLTDASEDVVEETYRARSGTAVAALTFALLSPLAFLGWWLLAVPLVGLVLGLVALGDIRRRPTALTGRGLALVAVALAVLCFGAALGYLSIVYATELPPGHERLGYAALQPAAGDPPTAVPATALALDGRDVLIKGYMYPGSRQRGIVQFLLVRDQGDCCFGGNPKITDRVLVQLADLKGIEFSPRLRKVAGRFRVEPTGTATPDGGVLYHIDDARLR